MTTYRSAGMMRPPHGTKGHTLVVRHEGNPGAPPLIPAEPHLWRCLRCHEITTDPADVTSRWCPDAHRALRAGERQPAT
jgi:hypothetical protein